ncbi:hypothetical protein RhiirA4_548660 [Rhizophagus irregularis]|uniref:Uncharacterized protein n=1 Tax=Rhizophagus irregularis TaxID=588596 RepID=A0A2I1H8U7_9GLOM|nr:hypothetical protein RhiirA4_548660 [Rhizophagus irregularis]
MIYKLCFFLSKKNTYVVLTEEEIKSMQTGAHGKATHNSFRKDIGLPGKIEDELCEIHGADAFIQEEIKKIINHPIMQPDSPKGLTRRIFWQNSFKLALRGGEHHNLKIQKRKDGGIDVTFIDLNVIRDLKVKLILKLNKRQPICEDAFYLQPYNNNEVEFMGYWLKYAQMGENREGISDNDVMSVSRLKNSYSLAYYERLKSIHYYQMTKLQILFPQTWKFLKQAQLNELNDDQQDQQNQEINGKDHQNRSPWKCFSEL